MHKNSEIITKMIGLLYPFIIMFGFYIIINGHLTPGGGFQGGAVLAAVFISRYLVIPLEDIKINSLQIIEKVLFIAIMLLPLLLIFNQIENKPDYFNTIYLIILNVLIGLKVFCGLTVILLRFVFYESR